MSVDAGMRSVRTIEMRPAAEARQLFILLHGCGGAPEDMVGTAELFRRAFPDAVLLLPEGFEPFSAGIAWGREWYPEPAATSSEYDSAARLGEAVARAVALVRKAQRDYGLLPTDTALVGFSQGATLALEAAVASDGLAGRVIAFAGRFHALPARAPQLSTLHFLHGDADEVVPVAHAQAALAHFEQLHGDATLDIASGLGHQLHPALVLQAIHRLQTCIPMRAWQRAMGSEPDLPQQ